MGCSYSMRNPPVAIMSSHSLRLLESACMHNVDLRSRPTRAVHSGHRTCGMDQACIWKLAARTSACSCHVASSGDCLRFISPFMCLQWSLDYWR